MFGRGVVSISRAVWLVPAALLIGCGDEVCEEDCDSAVDTAPVIDSGYEGELSLQQIDWTCDGADHALSAYTNGWVIAGQLSLTQGDSGWLEVHPVPVVDAQPAGYWTALAVQLEGGVALPEVVEGERSAFDCAASTSLQLQLDVFDESGERADCALLDAGSAPSAAAPRDTGTGDTGGPAEDPTDEDTGGSDPDAALDCEESWR